VRIVAVAGLREGPPDQLTTLSDQALEADGLAKHR
jgi:hypothetical protein